MPAAVIGGAIAAAGAVGGAALGASAQKKAAKRAAQAQLDATAQNNALAREQYAQNKSTLDPFIARGNAAGTNFNALMGLGTSDQQTAANNAFRTYIGNSDYAFQRDQGERGLAAKLSASGGVHSGAAIKATEEFGRNLDSGYRTQYLGLLGNQQGLGLSGASALAGVSNAYVNNVTNNNQNAADAQSNAALIRGNANAGLYSAIGNALGNFAGSTIYGGGFGGSFKPSQYTGNIGSYTPGYGGGGGGPFGMGWIGR